MITLYYVVEDKYLTQVVDRVNRLLANGWALQGGICYGIAINGSGCSTTSYCQALCKVKEEDAAD